MGVGNRLHGKGPKESEERMRLRSLLTQIEDNIILTSHLTVWC
jgi:hypothetical protein